MKKLLILTLMFLGLTPLAYSSFFSNPCSSPADDREREIFNRYTIADHISRKTSCLGIQISKLSKKSQFLKSQTNKLTNEWKKSAADLKKAQEQLKQCQTGKTAK